MNGTDLRYVHTQYAESASKGNVLHIIDLKRALDRVISQGFHEAMPIDIKIVRQ